MTEKCKWCDGTGRYEGAPDDPISDEECPACHGKGEVERQLELHEIDYR